MLNKAYRERTTGRRNARYPDTCTKETHTPEGLDEWTRREERRSCNNSSSRENESAHSGYSFAIHPQYGTGEGYLRHNGGIQKPAAPKKLCEDGAVAHAEWQTISLLVAIQEVM